MSLTVDLELAHALARLALPAGEAVLGVYASDFTVRHKQDRSPVTDADRRAEEVILAGLARQFPDTPVVAEEQVADGHVPTLDEEFFLVDPLDGTREFISRNGEFTVNIALIQRSRPAAGVVLAPATGALFIAARHAGAHRLSAPNSKADMSMMAQARPLSTAPPAGPLRAIASRSHRDAETSAYLEQLGVKEIISTGSSLKFCLLAAGDADVYPRFGRTMEWDTAAGQAVLECAGGAVLTLDGAPLVYGKRDAGFANPPFIAWARRPEI